MSAYTTRYAESDDGRIHAYNPLVGEYTLCGDAFEGFGVEFASDDEWKNKHKPGKGPVTCQDCALIIRGLKGIRIGKQLKPRTF